MKIFILGIAVEPTTTFSLNIHVKTEEELQRELTLLVPSHEEEAGPILIKWVGYFWTLDIPLAGVRSKVIIFPGGDFDPDAAAESILERFGKVVEVQR